MILFKKQLFDLEVKGQIMVIMVRDTLPYGHAPTYQISLTYLERQKCYDPDKKILFKLVLLSAQLTKIYPPLPTSVQPISITKTLLIVPTKKERDPTLFTGKLLIKFQNILRNTTQVIIRHKVKILFSVISSPITLERQK